MSRRWLVPSFALLAMLAPLALSQAKADKSDWPTKRSSDIDWGGDLFNKHCWQCHGRQAEGDGPATEALTVDVPSLRGISDPDTRGDLVATARKGAGPMPAYHESISRQDMRRVFLYIESLDDPEPKKKKKADPEPEDAEPEVPAEEGNAPEPEGGE